ncbi:MAG: tetratricopeptide repeat protein [Rhodoferax sp.]|jgi:predicted O-linked N-acetylglucosamine transferase (SPINDLY family)|nr:tetratricopeptide repeat protein [Rhodoferax sp.]
MKGQPPLARLAFPDLAASAGRMAAAGQRDAAVRLYADWLRHNPRSPSAFAAHFNAGCLLQEAGRLEEALRSYGACLRANPQFVQTRLNLGNTLDRLGRRDEAIAEWRKLLVGPVDPAFTRIALNNLGLVLEAGGQWGEAIEMLARSLAIDPQQDEVIYHWVRLRQRICAWPIYTEVPGITLEQMIARTSAVAMLSVTDDPALQRAAAQRNMAHIATGELPRLPAQSPDGHTRLRIGYLSSNFNLHAVSMLIAELLELHDRTRVEVFAFSWSPQDGSAMLDRIRAGVDHFVDIGAMTDAEAALAIHRAGIDVLIDLQGLTTNARPRILAQRPAPWQLTWLGHPGTVAVPGVDYLLADRTLVPEDLQVHYAERLLYLPRCYQVNDRKRPQGTALTRAAVGLPDGAFVFCALNNTNKFTPEMFGAWMDILRATPGSLLWLLADNPQAEQRLQQHVLAAGIAAERVRMAPRVDYADYLARLPLADLFLDTFPFNGGVTTSDALWQGLPVLTRSGRSFASRMSGSLLQAADLPELVTHSLADYQALAIALAQDPERLRALRQRLQHGRDRCALFDTPQTCRDLEDLLLALVRGPRDGVAG